MRFGRLVVDRMAEPAKRSSGGGPYWVCVCDCGNEKIIRAASLAQGTTKSCGCLKQESIKPKGVGDSAKNKVIQAYRAGAKKRGYTWELSDGETLSLLSGPCHYCGTPHSNFEAYRFGAGGFAYNGIDRVDNTKGYELENVVSCCRTCNQAKLTMGYAEFLSWVALVFRHMALDSLLSSVENASLQQV